MIEYNFIPKVEIVGQQSAFGRDGQQPYVGDAGW